ncbi:MAG: enoyl-CoA hydratase [Ilumatobacteraceae bacterium]|nr:enoyl-CoA hydratase [Ilumatobacteraceae bacterium]
MTSDDDEVVTTREADVAIVELNRPGRANSMGPAIFPALAGALRALAGDASVRSIVLCGAGRHFCAGGDLDHPLFDEDDEVLRRQQIVAAYEVTQQLLAQPQPIVTAVQGRCAGAALALVLASDLRVASRAAVFSLDFVRLGLAPDMGVCWLLAPAIGTGRALDLALTGEPMSASQAHEWGIVSRLVDDGEERSTALALAHALAAHPPGGMAAIRQMVRTVPFASREAGFRTEIDTMTRLAASVDARDRLQQFRVRSRGAAR